MAMGARRRRRRQQPANRSVSLAATWRVWLGPPALIAATMIAYLPAWHGGILWDDDHHLTNARLRSLHGLWRIWFDLSATQQYYPLTHSAFWLESHMWGASTLGYHLVNIALHAIAAGLVWVIFRRLKVPGAALAATIFALHPVNVESVAWMSELKNTLSGVLYLGAALVYLHFDDCRRRAAYTAALALFALALLAKSVTATLPAALLVVIWWQRGKLEWRRDFVPLVPFFLAGIGMGAMTAWAERTLIGAQGSDFQFSLFERSLIAGRALWFYLAKLVWPANLTFIYPRWTISVHDIVFDLCLAGAIGVFVAAWLARGRTRAPLAAFLFFAITLGPALGFLNVYPFRFSFVADHFQYLAQIGPIALDSAGIALASAPMKLPAAWFEAAAIGVLCVPLAWLTWGQAREYADATTLYVATIAKNPACWLAYNNLGALDLELRVPALDDAVLKLRTAIRLNPAFFESHTNLGNALARKGDPGAAKLEYREALRLRPDSAEAHNNLGNVLHQLGQIDDAIVEHREALRLEPGYADAHDDYAIDLQAEGRYEEALVEHTAAAQLDPLSLAALNGRGRALEALHQSAGAIAAYQDALRLEPHDQFAHFHLANALQGSGQLEASVREYEAALDGGESASVHHNLGLALARLGRLPEAAAQFKVALKIDPKDDGSRKALERIQTMQKIDR
jgi:tetratricopeptide (TPR) repeat protein